MITMCLLQHFMLPHASLNRSFYPFNRSVSVCLVGYCFSFTICHLFSSVVFLVHFFSRFFLICSFFSHSIVLYLLFNLSLSLFISFFNLPKFAAFNTVALFPPVSQSQFPSFYAIASKMNLNKEKKIMFSLNFRKATKGVMRQSTMNWYKSWHFAVCIDGKSLHLLQPSFWSCSHF